MTLYGNRLPHLFGIPRTPGVLEGSVVAAFNVNERTVRVLRSVPQINPAVQPLGYALQYQRHLSPTLTTAIPSPHQDRRHVGAHGAPHTRQNLYVHVCFQFTLSLQRRSFSLSVLGTETSPKYAARQILSSSRKERQVVETVWARANSRNGRCEKMTFPSSRGRTAMGSMV